MQYREVQPPAALAAWIECLWTLRGAGGGPDPVLPDGRTEIVLNFADRFRRHAPDGAVERQPAALFVGPMRQTVVLEPEGRVDILGIRLRPAAARALIEPPLAELDGHTPALPDVAPRLGSLLERTGNAHDRIGTALSEIRPLLTPADAPTSRLAHVVARIESLRGDIGVDRAAREVGWSSRQLQRRFLQDVGLGPKSFARVLRVQAAAREAPRAARIGWARIAATCGFFDQAHLIREFRTITGATPAAFFAGRHALAEAFTGV